MKTHFERLKTHHLHTKLPYQKPMLREIEWWAQNGPIAKNGSLPETTLLFLKFCFSLRTSYKELIWCLNNPNAHFLFFCKQWSFILWCFFPVSIFKMKTNKFLKNKVLFSWKTRIIAPVCDFSFQGILMISKAEKKILLKDHRYMTFTPKVGVAESGILSRLHRFYCFWAIVLLFIFWMGTDRSKTWPFFEDLIYLWPLIITSF